MVAPMGGMRKRSLPVRLGLLLGMCGVVVVAVAQTDSVQATDDKPADTPAASVQRELSAPRPQFRGPPGWKPVARNKDRARTNMLFRRADLRAYDGAPPIMPHSRNFAKTKSCLDCHASGIWLGERFGAPISHPHLLNCQQCHVESRNLELPWAENIEENTFEGMEAFRGGTTAWEGAPPVMPHATMMRTDCLSCHGPDSYPGLRTDHPERLNCVQCHAMAASLDQTSPFFTGNATLVEEQ